MALTVPKDLADAQIDRAARCHVPVERLLEEALSSYLALDDELRDELSGWQALGAEALLLVEDGPG
jgi:hypothetical protein